MKVLVTGATGFIGQEVLRQLLGAGHQPRVLVRNPNRAMKRLPEPVGDVEFHRGDVTDPSSLTGATRGCDAVIHLVGIISEFGSVTYERVHVEGTRNLVAATRADGVRRFVHMSALGTRADAVARYHQTKWAAEESVRGSGLDFTILRPSVIYGPEDHFVNLFVRLSKWSPVLPVIGKGTALMQPVAVETVAGCFVQALTQPAAIGQAYDLCGLDRLNFVQLLDAISEVTGRRRIRLHLPLPLARLQATAFELVFGRLLRKPPPLNRDQLIMLQEDNVGDPGPAERTFHLDQARFVEGIRKYLMPRAAD